MRRTLAAVVFASLLGTPSLSNPVWTFLESLWASSKEGCGADPDGLGQKEGCGMDPNGLIPPDHARRGLRGRSRWPVQPGLMT